MIVLTAGPASLARLMRRDGVAPSPAPPVAEEAEEGCCGKTATPTAAGRR